MGLEKTNTQPEGNNPGPSEEYLALLMDTLADGVLTVSMPHRRVEFVNRATTELFGRTAEEMVGHPTREFFADNETYAVATQALQEALSQGRDLARAELRFKRSDGNIFLADVVSTFMRRDGELYQTISVVRDITLSRQTEDQRQRATYSLKERVKELTTLHRAGQILQSGTATDAEILGEIAAILPAGWQYPEACVARLELDGYEYRSPGFVPPLTSQKGAFHIGDGRIGHIEVGYVDDRPQEAEGPYLAEERNLLSTISDMLRTTFARRAAEERAKLQMRRLVALRRIDMAISSNLDLNSTLAVVLDEVTGQLNIDAAAIHLYNPQRLSLDLVTTRGFRTPGSLPSHLALGKGLAGRVALERRLIGTPEVASQADDVVLPPELQGEGVLAYYGVPLISKGMLKGVLEVYLRKPPMPDDDWVSFLETLASQAAIAVEDIGLFEGLQRSNDQLRHAYEATLEGWVQALDLRDKETEGHTQRVTELTLQVAQAMGYEEEELTNIRRGALLHDIGKLGIPDSILLKAGPLTEDEWVVMRRHPGYAYEWLSPIPYLKGALNIPHCHHEKWDGTGYPRGLKGESIPIEARIFALVDVWDALRSDRPYRPAWPEVKVRNHIRSLSGTHFDPKIAEVFLRVVGTPESHSAL